MPDAFTLGLPESPAQAVDVLVRLLSALVMGALVAVVYRRTRTSTEVSESFSITLVLLAILIAMVTQVIGNNVARAFSLVGALSIVRFRTVVRDTQDTAYVIFAVAVGMAAGASNLVVGVGGMVVVALAAFAMRPRNGVVGVKPVDELPFELTVRLGPGADADAVLGPTLDGFGVSRQLVAVATVKQGMAVEVAYRVALDERSSSEVVNALNRIDGVQGVTLRRVADGERP